MAAPMYNLLPSCGPAMLSLHSSWGLRGLGACLGGLLSGATVAAQPTDHTKPEVAMMEKCLAQETAKLSQRFLDGATTLEEWKARLPRLRREYLDMLGLWPLPE